MTKFSKLLAALVLTAGVVGATAAPALAAEWDNHRDFHGDSHRDFRGNERRADDWRDHHRAFYPAPYAYAPSYGYAAPVYGYAPSYGYGAPPVVYAPPALSFNLRLPIR